MCPPKQNNNSNLSMTCVPQVKRWEEEEEAGVTKDRRMINELSWEKGGMEWNGMEANALEGGRADQTEAGGGKGERRKTIMEVGGGEREREREMEEEEDLVSERRRTETRNEQGKKERVLVYGSDGGDKLNLGIQPHFVRWKGRSQHTTLKKKKDPTFKKQIKVRPPSFLP